MEDCCRMTSIFRDDGVLYLKPGTKNCLDAWGEYNSSLFLTVYAYITVYAELRRIAW
jgi:hypothetical protein